MRRLYNAKMRDVLINSLFFIDVMYGQKDPETHRVGSRTE